MTEELSKRDIQALAENNVGLLPEVEEAVELLRAATHVIARARRACMIGERKNAAKAEAECDDEASATADAMYKASAVFNTIIGHIESLAKYA